MCFTEKYENVNNKALNNTWDAPEPITIHVGAPMDHSWLMIHPMDAQFCCGFNPAHLWFLKNMLSLVMESSVSSQTIIYLSVLFVFSAVETRASITFIIIIIIARDKNGIFLLFDL